MFQFLVPNFSTGKNKLLQNLIFKFGNLDIIAEHAMRAYINASYKGYHKNV